MKGILITLEGNDGSGKSSVIEAIRKTLEEKGYPVVYTREPGGSQIAENIRKVILDVENTGMDARTEALLYAASRREHIEKTIRPALQAGQIVLCDRFIDSSLAYQGYARGLGIDEVYHMNLYATEGLLPDLTILVCVKPEIGIARITQNHRGELDRLESEKMEFHQKVYQGYLEVQKKFPSRIQMIDGEKTKEEVRIDALDIVLRFIGEK
ncbi:MAG: dTMP kinase [Anaeroplasma bactoclasticum]|nr:dTMP kinase [Anaeroplasma bactoclasticum]